MRIMNYNTGMENNESDSGEVVVSNKLECKSKYWNGNQNTKMGIVCQKLDQEIVSWKLELQLQTDLEIMASKACNTNGIWKCIGIGILEH